MSQDNHITLRGYLTAEPTLHQKTAAATPLTEIRVGSTPRRLNRETGEWHDAPTSYYRVKCWRRLAINAASSLHKGDMVVVHGRFYMSTWVDSQQRPRSTLEIEADSLGHDLTYGWSHFLRGTRSQPERAAGVNAGEMARQDVGPANPDAESAAAYVGDDEYSGDGDPAESRAGEAALAPSSQADPAGLAGDPPADESATQPASAVSITESEGFGDLGPGDALGASSLTDSDTLAEAEAVPF
ncbi:MAG TPA: single-stranded DNA-binding protein [Trebonia sp.]|nr:single-stranded DNA-binding protein [Trebonia sp.]